MCIRDRSLNWIKPRLRPQRFPSIFLIFFKEGRACSALLSLTGLKWRARLPVLPTLHRANATSFFRYGACHKNLYPPYPPVSKGGDTYRNSFESPPLKKGDLGGFKNQQTERIYGKGYNLQVGRRPMYDFPGPKLREFI